MAELPEGWVKCMSKKFGKAYYFHADTNKSVWIHPKLLKKDAYEKPVPKKQSTQKQSSESNSDEPAPKKLAYSLTRGSLDSLSSSLSEKDLQKLTAGEHNDRQYFRKKTAHIKNWAESVTRSQLDTPVPIEKVKEFNIKVNSDNHVPELKPLPVLKNAMGKGTSRLKGKSNSIVKKKPSNKELVTTNKKIPACREGTGVNVSKRNTRRLKTRIKSEKDKKTNIESDKDSVISLNAAKYVPYKKPQKPLIKGSTSSVEDADLKSKGKRKEQSADSATDSKTKRLAKTKVAKNENGADENANLPQFSPYQQTTEIQRKRKNSTASHASSFSYQSNPNLQAKTTTLNPFFNDLLQAQRKLRGEQKHAVVVPDSTEMMDQEEQMERKFDAAVSYSDQTALNLSSRYEIASQSYAKQGEDEEMDVDDAVQLSREIMKEIKDIREEQVIPRPEVPKEEQLAIPVYSDPLYIVVDTNILLGHLNFISDLKDYPLPGIGAPILVIPWMVLQELDSLKDAVNRHHTQTTEDGKEDKTYKLNVLARQAIKFISVCLEGDHPRLKGESVIEAGLPITGFAEETNDDNILHCGLSLKTRATHSHIVILSNDRNLCNKAIVLGMKAFAQKDLMLGLQSLFQNGTVAVRKENYEEYYEEYRKQELVAQRRKQADDLSIELQCVLREGFSKIIETELQTAYDEMWLQIVKIQPPWTLHDTFSLLEGHWIAVFGMVVKRNLSSKIKELKELFWAKQGKPGNLDNLKNMLDLSLQIFESFSIHSNYDDMLTKCITANRVLLCKCNEFLNQISSNPPLPAPEGEQQNTTAIRGPGNEECQSNPHEKVLSTFDAIWKTVTHFSALIFYGLNFPSPLIKDLDPNEAKPSKEETILCLNTMAPLLLQLIKMIQKVITVPLESLSSSEQIVANVLQAVYAFMKEVMKQDCRLNANEFLLFLQDNQTRTALIQGLSQLDRSYAMLQQCIEYHSS